MLVSAETGVLKYAVNAADLIFGLLAQLVEHLAFNQGVTGSIPVQPTNWFRGREVVILALSV